MTEVAAVSGQANANAGSGAAKGGAKGTGSALDGAFAALFGAAGGKIAVKAADSADGKAVTQAKPGAQTPDVALTGETTVEVDPQTILADSGIKTEVTEQSDADTKVRKPSTRRKSDADQTDAQTASLMGAFAAVITNVPPVPQAKPQNAAAFAGVQSVPTAAPVAVDVTAAATAPVAAKPDADKGKPDAGKESKTAVVADAPAQPAPTPASSVAVNTTGQQNDQTPDSRNGSGKDKDQPASPQLAANDDATAPAGSLQDIVQSLPPMLQSQLNVADLGAPAVPTLSTGDQLSNHVIDMGVQGQWIDRMAREIATLASGTGHSSFQLSPPNLGKIQVDLMPSGDKTNVRILTETDEATQRLRDGQSALEANARVASLSLGSVSIQKSQTPSDSGRDPNQRQSADSGNADQQQQQASAQAQSQSGQNRGGGINRGGFAAVMGQEQQAEAEPAAGANSAGDPGVRFA